MLLMFTLGLTMVYRFSFLKNGVSLEIYCGSKTPMTIKVILEIKVFLEQQPLRLSAKMNLNLYPYVC